MTQLTGSARITRQNAVQIVAAVAVAAVGISFGRWVVPAGDSTSGSSLTANSISTTSVAETIAERHFEQRGGYGEAEVLGAVTAPNYTSAAETIAERHFDLRGGYSAADPAGVVSIPNDSSATETPTGSHDPAASFTISDPAGVAVITPKSAAWQIAQRKVESGRLDEVLFGDGS